MSASTDNETVIEDEAAHQFGALNTLLIVVVLGICILCAYVIRQNKLYMIPESTAAVLVGIIVGALTRGFYPSKDELDFLSFNTEMFYFILLPPIIFEAGYTMKKKHFFENLGSIILFAVLGTLTSTFVIGYLTYLAGSIGMIKIDVSNPMEPLLFGALISASDTVATLSIIGSPDFNCDPLLYSLVFGESILNDAVSIVLFHTFLGEYTKKEVYSLYSLPKTLVDFSIVSFGSLTVGALIGLSCSFLFKHSNLKEYPKFEVSLLFLFAYGSYGFAESVDLSGVMALFFNGLILSHYNYHNLSSAGKITAEFMFSSMSSLSEFFVFLYMGMGVFTGRFKSWDPIFVFLAVLFCLAGRTFNIFPFSMLANMWRKRKITKGMQISMWFSGLRGAIAFALSQTMPGNSKDVYASTTLMVVLITTLVCGTLTEPLLGKMNVKVKNGEGEWESLSNALNSEDELQEMISHGANDSSLFMRPNRDRFTSSEGSISFEQRSFKRNTTTLKIKRIKQKIGYVLDQIDKSYMRPLFGGNARMISEVQLFSEAAEAIG